MRLRALRVSDVRGFAGRGVALEDIPDGLSALIRDNGFGKTSLLAALEALLAFKHGSTKAEVQALRPHAGGAPTVSADLAFPDGVFRIEKRFLFGRHARVTALPGGALIAQADRAEDWIRDRLGGGWAEADAALLWVRQGEAGNFLRGEAARRRTLADTARDAAAEATGEDRLQALLARARESKAKLLSDKQNRPKAGGPLDMAEKAVARLAAELAEAKAALDRIEADAEALRRTEEALRDWTDPEARAEAAAALAAAREAAEAEREAEARRSLAASRLRLAELARAEAAAALAAHDAAQTAHAAAAAADSLAAEGLARAQDEAQAAAARASAARAAAAEGARAAEAAAQAETAARAAEAARRAGAERRELEGRLAAAQAALAEARIATARAAELAVAPAALTAAEAAEAALRAAEARRDAARPVARMAYAAPDAAPVRLDGRALAEGETVRLDGAADFAILGIGVLTVAPGISAAEGETAVADAAQALRAALAPTGCADLAALRARLAAAAEARSRAKAATDRAAVHAPEGPEALAARLAALPAAPDGAGDGLAASDPAARDLGALAEATAAARRSEEPLRRAESAAVAAEAAAGAALTAALAARAQAADRLEAAGIAAGAASGRDARRAALDGALAEAIAAEDACRAETAAAGEIGGLQALTVELERREAAALERETQIARLSERRDGLRGRLQTEAGTAERHADLAARLEAAEAEAARWRREAEALKRLETALVAAEASLRARVHAPLRAALEPMLARVFGGPAALAVDDAALAPAGLARPGGTTPQALLSGGEQEQVAILTRLAFAAMMDGGRGAPAVILDDALAHSDDRRLERMFDALAALADRLQIVVFSCHGRAFRAMGGRLLEPTDWRPDQR